MNRFERWSVWSTTAAIAVTGVGFAWTKYLTASSDPFSAINHPLQPLFLKLHILVAPLFLFAIGSVAVRHIWNHFRSGTRRSRRSGITAALSVGPMVATGYLIQVLTGEAWLRAMVVAHIALGLLYLAGIGLHQWFLARSTQTKKSPRTKKVKESSVHPATDRLTAGFALVLAVGTLAACGERAPDAEERAVAPDTRAEAAAEAQPAFRGTPPGGLEAWISDIRGGLEGLPSRVRGEPDAAGQRVLDLYLSRQEYIERYYGTGGPRAGGDSLAAAVDAAEARFHELMRLTARTPPPDSAEVDAAIASLEARLEVVLRRAREAGVPLDPPAPASGGAAPASGGAADAKGGAAVEAEGGQGAGLLERLEALEAGLRRVEREAEAGRGAEARRRAVRLYLDHYEPIEGFYGPGAPHGAPGLAERVAAGEEAFHRLMKARTGEVAVASARLRTELEVIRAAAREADVPLEPSVAELAADVPAAEPESGARAAAGTPTGGPESPELARIVAWLRTAEAAYADGDTAGALAEVEAAYLEGFEPLEPRLPSVRVRSVERLFHLRLRPLIARGAPAESVSAAFATARAELAAADAELGAGAPFWFGAFNAFAIILREGLEAVLLIGAILAYLGKISADPRHRRQVYAGVGVGVAASLATWAVARLVVPVGGAGRELIEGVTALVAVGVLVYVSHWLFHKTYVHDWRKYLTERVGSAVTTGSSLAMAALAFAAVYREGFETVLFYQALLFDVGPGPILAGFVPGLVLILGLGVAIIRIGMRLPLRKAFAATNAILLYLAFVFLGKGLYNLQEAGLFTPRPVAWMPDHEALRQLLGIYPVAETLAAQAAFLVLLSASYLWVRGRAAKRGRIGERTAADRPASRRAVATERGR